MARRFASGRGVVKCWASFWMAQIEVLQTWSNEIGHPQTIRCEIVEVETRRRTDDRKFLRDLVLERLGLGLSYPVDQTFTDGGRAAAMAYLRRGLTKTQAYGSPLMSATWTDEVVQALPGFMPKDTTWFSTEETHEECPVESLGSATHRWGTPLSLDRTFESLVAGIASKRAFLFYAWDED